MWAKDCDLNVERVRVSWVGQMAHCRSTWFRIAATAAWIAALSGGIGFQATSAHREDGAVSQVLNDGSAPFHIAFLAPNELVSSDESDVEVYEIDQDFCDGGNTSSPREGSCERLRARGDREWSSPPFSRFSARGPPRC
jgi:hypothetical protein